MELNSIAFIPDGNRRYAKGANISLLESYQVGTKKAWEVIDWLKEYPKIKVGTFYTLSLENMQRNADELNLLFNIFDRELDKVLKSDYLGERGIKLNFIGRLNMLPKKLQEKIAQAEKTTADFCEKTVNLAIGYNGQVEIVDAAKKIALDYRENKVDLDKLDQKTFQNYLYSTFNPDLIIRTSGTKRLSGFLTYASSYSELYFCEKNWPEFSRGDLKEAVDDYYSRIRKYGL